MRQQTHECIPPWVTQRAQLNREGWYRVCGTIHPLGMLLHGGSILIEGEYSFSAGSWVVSYGYWNRAGLEAMFVAPFSLSSDTTTGYERTHYCAGPYAIQCSKKHPNLDADLAAKGVQSWTFITAENPKSHYTPKHNQAYNQVLCDELVSSGLHFQEGWGVPHCASWDPEASFLVFGVDKDTAIFLKEKYKQSAVVFGEIGEAAVLL